MKPTDPPADAGHGSTPVEGVLAPNPGPLTLDGTRTWLVGSGSVVLIDPGPALPEHLARVQAAVGGRVVDAILLTHAHADHAGGTAAAARAFGAPVMASSATLARTGLAGRVLREGDTVPVGGSGAQESTDGTMSLQVIETPGHAADHISFLLIPDRWLFTGDLVLGEGSSAVLHPDGRMSEYLASIRNRGRGRTVRRVPPSPSRPRAADRAGDREWVEDGFRNPGSGVRPARPGTSAGGGCVGIRPPGAPARTRPGSSGARSRDVRDTRSAGRGG
jgi:glyoxylase-like metal-dependent hydrolase (beta-lactamase superfamily II)